MLGTTQRKERGCDFKTADKSWPRKQRIQLEADQTVTLMRRRNVKKDTSYEPRCTIKGLRETGTFTGLAVEEEVLRCEICGKTKILAKGHGDVPTALCDCETKRLGGDKSVTS